MSDLTEAVKIMLYEFFVILGDVLKTFFTEWFGGYIIIFLVVFIFLLRRYRSQTKRGVKRVAWDFAGRIKTAAYEDTLLTILAIGAGVFAKDMIFYYISNPSRAEKALYYLVACVLLYGGLAFLRTARHFVKHKWSLQITKWRVEKEDASFDLIQKIRENGGDVSIPPSTLLPGDSLDSYGDDKELIPWWERMNDKYNNKNSVPTI